MQDISLAHDLQHLLAQVEATRTRLEQAQGAIRTVSTVEGTASLPVLVAARDDARRSHVHQLSRAMQQGEEHQARSQRYQQESAALLQQAMLASSEQQRLDALQTTLLPALGGFTQQLPRMHVELSALREHLDGAMPDTTSLHGLHAAWEEAADELHDARHEEMRRRPKPDAALTTQRARGRLQQAERYLRSERALLWQTAFHFPELLAHEPLLRLGGVDGEAIRRVLVERELDQYAGPEGAAELLPLAGHLRARHCVFRAEFGVDAAGHGLACVLKEYELDGTGGEWRRLIDEVEALQQLAHPHIVEVQAVFQPTRPPTATPVAYVQLPFYANGDAASWRSRTSPELWKRQRVLLQVSQALHHLHARGFAHGDLKLENVLISASETAHLADFESVREQPQAATATRLAHAATHASILFATARYVAPEMHASPECAKPTSATDMYAFGVCALLLCCDERDCAFGPPPNEQLERWSREAAVSNGGEHLPPLLDGLLDLGQPPATSIVEALRRRMSAAEVLRHPFLNTEAEREAARRAREEAEAAHQHVHQQRDEAQQAAERERAEIVAEQRRRQWEASQRQRALDEQQRRVAREEQAVAQEVARIALANRELQQQSADVARRTREEVDRQKAAEAKKRKAEQDLAVEQAKLTQLRHEQAQQRQRAPAISLWVEHTGTYSSQELVHKFFARRQQDQRGGTPLKIMSATAVPNEATLRAFVSSGNFEIDPMVGWQKGRSFDTLLFHGCSQEAASNIQQEGLRLQYASIGMLGQGLYGAPDPRKSRAYCRGGTNGNFMFICRFHLTRNQPHPAQHAGPTTNHRNSIFDEFCIFDERHVVILWALKVQ